MSQTISTKREFKLEDLWTTSNKLRNTMDPSEYKHVVLGLIFLKYISDSFDTHRNKLLVNLTDKNSEYFISESEDDVLGELEIRDNYTASNIFWVPKDARWDELRNSAKQSDIGERIDNALEMIESDNPSLFGKLPKIYGALQLPKNRLGKLIDFISTIGLGGSLDDGDLLGEIYEYFLGKFASQEGKKGGEFYTPKHVVKALVSCLAPYKGRVYDPCCGSGGMFVQSEDFVLKHGGNKNDISIYGQESNPTTWKLASMNLAIRGISADLGNQPDDTLGNDQHRDKLFDFILVNPPFNDSDWGGDSLKNDSRWKYGIPPNGNANFAWLQHVIHKLNNNGKAGIVLGTKSLDSAEGMSEYQIRKSIIQDNLVEAIVLLPERLFTNTTTEICLWIINKNKKSNKEILFINYSDMSSPVEGERTRRHLSDKKIQDLEEIFKSWQSGENYSDKPGLHRASSLEEVEKNNWNLSPKRYVGTASEKSSENFDGEELIKNNLNNLIDAMNQSSVENNNTKETIESLDSKKYSEILSVDKTDWLKISVGEIFTVRNEKVGDRKIIPYSCTNDGITKRENKFKKNLAPSLSKNKVAYRGDFVFGMSRKILNFGMMEDSSGCFSGAYKVYEVYRGYNFSKYLEYYIKSNHDYFYQCIPGGAREGKGIDEKVLFSLEVLVPPEERLNSFFEFMQPLNTNLNSLKLLEKELSNSISIINKIFMNSEQ